MRLEALETRIEEFDERNLVLQVLLGFASAVEIVDRVFERHVAAEGFDQDSAAQPEDALLVDFALGVLSFRQTVSRLLSNAATPRPEHGGMHASLADVHFDGVLR